MVLGVPILKHFRGIPKFSCLKDTIKIIIIIILSFKIFEEPFTDTIKLFLNGIL